MAENWNDYGDYGEEERYKNSSFWGKLFSFKTLKTLLKILLGIVLLGIYGILFFRLCTGGPSGYMKKLLKTDADIAAYEKYGSLSVFSQMLSVSAEEKGKFFIYDVRIIAETNEVQMTIRYNNSIVETLKDDISARFTAEQETEKAEALSAVSDTPFVFVLRDEDGNVYTGCAYVTYSKNLYKYLRIAFTVPNLTSSLSTSPDVLYPTGTPSNPLYIYKGAGAGTSEYLKKLSLEMYYENEVDFNGGNIGASVTVYKADAPLEKYNCKNELRGGVSENIVYIDVKSLDKSE